jgi:septal ring factor EnvC (AmiA/AmiB activator)
VNALDELKEYFELMARVADNMTEHKAYTHAAEMCQAHIEPAGPFVFHAPPQQQQQSETECAALRRKLAESEGERLKTHKHLRASLEREQRILRERQELERIVANIRCTLESRVA